MGKPNLSPWGQPATLANPNPKPPKAAPAPPDVPIVDNTPTMLSPDEMKDRHRLVEEQRRFHDLIAISGGPAQLLKEIRRLKAEDSLSYFTEHAWPSIETVPLVWNWSIDAICDHLRAVALGQIRRLIINVPPRTLKSSLVSVLYPAWTWAQPHNPQLPLSGPQVRFLFASYSQNLSERDSVRTRRLIDSPWYQSQWGDRYKLVGDQNTKRRFETDHNGYRIATSVGGTLTGEGGDILICLAEGTLIDTPKGQVPIEQLAQTGGQVFAFDHSQEKAVISQIVAHSNTIKDEICEIYTASGNSVRLTPDHLVFAERRGYIRADSLVFGDRVLIKDETKEYHRPSDYSMPLLSSEAPRWRFTGVTHVAHLRGLQQRVYDLTIARQHNLFAGGILVHNCDDPLSAQEANSELVRDSTNQWWDEVMSTRLNDPKHGAYIIIMQRLHEDDTTGHILSKATAGEYTHLMLPMEFDPTRHSRTYINGNLFYEDPRTDANQLLFPARFSKQQVENLKTELGPYGYAGQMQQSPSPRGGGIIKREWWQAWPPDGQEEIWTHELPDPKSGVVAPRVVYPDFDFIVASLDTAYTEREENDYSACTVWGVFEDQKTKAPRIMLISAWRDRLALNSLVERTFKTTRRKNLEVDAVLIEAKASGHSVGQELKRLMRPGEFTLYLLDPKHDGGGDKVARMYAAQPTFAAKQVYAPFLPPDYGSMPTWAEGVISECEQFPKSKFKDWADSTSQAIIWLRKRGLARMQFEYEEDTRPRPWTSGQRGIEKDYGL